MKKNPNNQEKQLIAKERLRKYNEHPFVCKCCGHPIKARDTKHLKELKRRKKEGHNIFCNQSCAATYNNKHYKNSRYENRTKTLYAKHPVAQLSDMQIKNAFVNVLNSANPNVRDFLRMLELSNTKDMPKQLEERLTALGLDKNLIIQKGRDYSNIKKGDYLGSDADRRKFREMVTTNAKSVYDKSGRPHKCCVCGYEEHVDMAHINAVSSFGANATINKINNINNIAPLCPNCHWKFDKGTKEMHDQILVKIKKFIMFFVNKDKNKTN